MRLLLCIQSPFNHFLLREVVSPDTDIASLLERVDGLSRVRFVPEWNGRPLERLGRIANGEHEPVRDCIAGNAYYGNLTFFFERKDLRDGARHRMKVLVYSALGSTLSEHDERYRRLKDLRSPSEEV